MDGQWETCFRWSIQIRPCPPHSRRWLFTNHSTHPTSSGKQLASGCSLAELVTFHPYVLPRDFLPLHTEKPHFQTGTVTVQNNLISTYSKCWGWPVYSGTLLQCYIAPGVQLVKNTILTRRHITQMNVLLHCTKDKEIKNWNVEFEEKYQADESKSQINIL